MYSKNIHNMVGTILIAVVAISSSIFAGGSISVYNYSYYKVNFVVTTQNTTQAAAIPPTYSYVQMPLVSAPTDAAGLLQMHPTDANYAANSNVPLGTVANVTFTDTAKDFDIQIYDTSGKLVKQINLGKTLGTVVDNDASRAVYIYSNINSVGLTMSNSGGAVYYWDAAHPIANPSIQTFTSAATA